MIISWVTFVIVCPLVFLAGLVDSIAGGGGLISLPAYLLAGVPMHHAIGTNKLSSASGTLVSTIRYCKNNHRDLAIGIPSIAFALLGSAVGANLSLLTDDKILKVILIIILPVVSYYVLKNKNFESKIKMDLTKRTAFIIAMIAAFVIGMYDGFYGPGTGTFLLLFYTGVIKMDVLTASGNVKLINLSSNIAALAIYIYNGKVLFVLGLVAAIFSIAGHYMGSGMVMKSGTKIVRPIIIVVLVLLFIKVIVDFI